MKTPIAYIAGADLTADYLSPAWLSLADAGYTPTGLFRATFDAAKPTLRSVLESNVADLMDADVVVTMPGWEGLPSSRMAVELATMLGKPVRDLWSLVADAVA